MRERRKDKLRRKIAAMLPALTQFCRTDKDLDPKEIGKIINKPAWYVRRVIGRMK